MYRQRKKLDTITMKQLYQYEKLPKLFRTYNRRQMFEMIAGLATIMFKGIGILILLASLLDLYFFSYTFTVRDMKTGESYLMSKPEWKEYRKVYKEENSK